MADGCDGFEFDVRLTADGQAVVYHDPKVGRLQIAHATAQQLPSLPRLQDVLSRYPEAFLDIELKVPGLERIVIEALRECKLRRFVVSSFLPEVLTTLHAANAGIPLGLICETKAELHNWQKIPIDCVILHYKLVDPLLIRQMKDAGKKILVWTVNLPADMQRFAGYGVDGIISDDTGLLCRTLTA